MIHRFTISIAAVFILALFGSGVSYGEQSPEDATNPLFKEAKVKNYLPHMTWKEVEQMLGSLAFNNNVETVLINRITIDEHGKIMLDVDVHYKK